jgi:phosphoribosyl 1,2-cyclic phosphodiesterase
MYGHLSNAAAGEIARSVAHGGLRQLVAAHLSQQNNRPELARQAMLEALGSATEIMVADAGAGTHWLDV